MSTPQALKEGEQVRLSKQGSSAVDGILPTTYPDLVDALQPGDPILINDGKIRLTSPSSSGRPTGE